MFICDTLFALLPSPGTQVENNKNVTYNHLLVSALGSFSSLFSFVFLFLFICEGTYFLSGLMTFKNQMGNENVMSASLGEEMYKESSSTDDGKRGPIWKRKEK